MKDQVFKEWIQKNVLMQSDEDIKEIAKQNKENPPPVPEGFGSPTSTQQGN